MGSIALTHLHTGWHVDQAILHGGDEHLVCIRFGSDLDAQCMAMDEILSKIQPKVRGWCDVYVVDNKEVTDFNAMYEIYDPCTVMFFFR